MVMLVDSTAASRAVLLTAANLNELAEAHAGICPYSLDITSLPASSTPHFLCVCHRLADSILQLDSVGTFKCITGRYCTVRVESKT
ncbi:hypothetical protein JAAARDRAFT_62453 [Jaapia argillacea MUCL 33604]|uniref:Uncharacterized protein n=1 Tax=Jaapia argillacea MUCL 33604 TaxID=933084 RepID=A0A067PKM8_9AGAM|nr:hypothetical protein JAAARDRAFT_62453 [Jaapia argillacea MUCL 33604]